MRDYLTISSVPYDEPCTQVGHEDYNRFSQLETKAFLNQCRRVLKEQFGDKLVVSCSVKSFLHDFGTYKEVVVYYDDSSQTQIEQAFWLEDNAPENWDEEAKEELGQDYFNTFRV